MDIQVLKGLLGLFLFCGSVGKIHLPGGPSYKICLFSSPKETAFFDDKVSEVRRYFGSSSEVKIQKRRIPREERDSDGYFAPFEYQHLRYSVTSRQFEPLYNLLHPGGRREITSAALEMVGARAAAWLWAQNARFLPDGGVKLIRVGNEPAEAQIIANWLFLLCMGVQAKLDLNMPRPRLIFSRYDTIKICDQLRSYAPISKLDLFEPPHGLAGDELVLPAGVRRKQ